MDELVPAAKRRERSVKRGCLFEGLMKKLNTDGFSKFAAP
jgi:hypothetical protein